MAAPAWTFKNPLHLGALHLLPLDCAFPHNSIVLKHPDYESGRFSLGVISLIIIWLTPC
jgi:hypothetical protein